MSAAIHVYVYIMRRKRRRDLAPREEVSVLSRGGDNRRARDYTGRERERERDSVYKKAQNDNDAGERRGVK